jgi:hypothetical protein
MSTKKTKTAKVKPSNVGDGIGFTRLSAEKRTEIARKGGLAISQDRAHMAAISKLGQEARRKKKEQTLAANQAEPIVL